MFTPVIVNEEAGYTQTCGINVWSYLRPFTSIVCNTAQVTAIPDGLLTISHTGAMMDTRKPPIPVVVRIGPSPPPTARETATITSTTTTLSTFTTWGGYKSTHTEYVYYSTWTRQILVPGSETTTRTHYVTACPPTKSSGTPTLPPGVLLNKCDEDNGKILYTEAGPFEITCGFELDVKTSGRMQSKNGMLGCIDLCVHTRDCTGMVYFEAKDDCYLKFGRGTANKNMFAAGAELKGARQFNPSFYDTTIDPHNRARGENPAAWSTLPSPSSTIPVVASPLPPVHHPLSNRWASCPEDHRKLFIAYNAAFLIVCGYDRSGITTGPFPTIGLNECIRLCSTTEDCIFVSYRRKTHECYLKFGQGDVHINPDSQGAQLRAMLPDVASEAPVEYVSGRPVPAVISTLPFDLPPTVSLTSPPRVTKVSRPVMPTELSSLSSGPPPKSTLLVELPSRPAHTHGMPAPTPSRSRRLGREEARQLGFHKEPFQGRGPDYTFIPELTTATSTITATTTQYTTTFVSPPS
jgi:hypothetical protein